MSKTTYSVMSHSGIHEYNIVVEETDKGKILSLYLSNGLQWSSHVRGQLEVSIIDTGSGITFLTKVNKNINYSELFYLRLLFNLELQLNENKQNKIPHILLSDKDSFKL